MVKIKKFRNIFLRKAYENRYSDVTDFINYDFIVRSKRK